MHLTSHSEYHPLRSVLLNPPKSAFISQARLDATWEELNYTASPDFKKALGEYRRFESLLHQCGITVFNLPETRALSPDAIYCRDASIITDYGVILCNMGKEKRAGEPEMHRKFYESHDMAIMGSITPPGTLEGGDVTWLDKNTLAVGLSYRSNEQGINQLRELLAPYPIHIVEADLPHYRGSQDVFHLMSVISPLNADLAVVYSPLLPIRFRNELLRRSFDLVEVPGKEFDSMGCNVLSVGNKTCLVVAGNPQTEKMLKNKGYQVLSYSGEEISIKGGGGPTCLTRPLQRGAG
jgi:N-dimethylarginine dimethylaminohydrolase